VDLSGLIFVALALVWGCVLIPKALRAHDDAARTRSVEASSDDARVLTRGGRVAAPAPADPPALPDDAGHPMSFPAAVAQQRRRATVAARRRRRVLGLLLLITGAVGVASLTGPLAAWSSGVPGALVLGFLLLARVMVRREQAAWEQVIHRLRASEALDEPAPEVVPAPRTVQEPDLHVVARNDQGVAVVSDTEDTSVFDAAVLAEAVGAPGGTLWDPLPVTLPTYVTKPRASRSVRTIDLSSASVSSSGHDAADTALVAEAAGPEEQEPPAQRAVGS
jgi:hypothetical protein